MDLSMRSPSDSSSLCRFDLSSRLPGVVTAPRHAKYPAIDVIWNSAWCALRMRRPVRTALVSCATMPRLFLGSPALRAAAHSLDAAPGVPRAHSCSARAFAYLHCARSAPRADGLGRRFELPHSSSGERPCWTSASTFSFNSLEDGFRILASWLPQVFRCPRNRVNSMAG
jgi:hypothetical protein